MYWHVSVGHVVPALLFRSCVSCDRVLLWRGFAHVAKNSRATDTSVSSDSACHLPAAVMRETTEIKRLETAISQMLLTVAALTQRAERAETDSKYYASKMNQALKLNRNMQLSAAQEQRAGAVSKIDSDSMYKKESGTLALMLERWHADDRPELCYRALYRSYNEDGVRLHNGLTDLEGSFLDEVRRQHYHERDQQIADHIQEGAFNPAVMNTLRVALGWSWNAVRWWRDTVKWDWSATDPDGKPSKARRMMAPDSRVPLPEPMCIKLMRQLQDEELKGKNVDHADGRGAEVTDVDATVLRALTSCDKSKMQGMATQGTLADPHWITVTLDGAGLTHDDSGVRLALICASVERMNQSTHAVHTISFWRASEHAEHWSTILARTKHVRPALCRLFKDGELLNADGSGSGVYVKLLVTADKPALCHMLGRRSFGHNFFLHFVLAPRRRVTSTIILTTR